ncbi:MAG: hypothetical protein NZ530_07995 [Thermodesulfobacteriaceae bacterium]|nr:hypothetical protein [Thermodesulfobacteriaceae bacterium]
MKKERDLNLFSSLIDYWQILEALSFQTIRKKGFEGTVGHKAEKILKVILRIQGY